MRYDIDKLMNVATFLAVLSAAVVALIAVHQRFVSPPPPPPVLASSNSKPREILEWRRYTDGGHRLGPAHARVAIIEFGDYQCPACRSWQPHIEDILREYPDDVAFIFRHWPLPYHQHAYPAARAAECAGAQGAFWAFHRRLYEDENWLGDAMTRFAIQAGVGDLDEFDRCLADPSPVPAIEADIAAANEIGAFGTPAIIVNGVLFDSPPDSQILEAMIQESR